MFSEKYKPIVILAAVASAILVSAQNLTSLRLNRNEMLLVRIRNKLRFSLLNSFVIISTCMVASFYSNIYCWNEHYLQFLVSPLQIIGYLALQEYKICII